jgi:hypothetical protein
VRSGSRGGQSVGPGGRVGLHLNFALESTRVDTKRLGENINKLLNALLTFNSLWIYINAL